MSMAARGKHKSELGRVLAHRFASILTNIFSSPIDHVLAHPFRGHADIGSAEYIWKDGCETLVRGGRAEGRDGRGEWREARPV